MKVRWDRVAAVGVAMMLAGAALSSALAIDVDWANVWDLLWRGAWATSRVVVVIWLEVLGLFIALWAARLVLVQPKPTYYERGWTDQGRAILIACVLIPVGVTIIWAATLLLP